MNYVTLRKRGLHPYLKSLIAKSGKQLPYVVSIIQLHAAKRSGKTKDPKMGLEQACAKWSRNKL